MALDYKKEYKEFYMPKNKPEIVDICEEGGSRKIENGDQASGKKGGGVNGNIKGIS